jgi:hypothetical protein
MKRTVTIHASKVAGVAGLHQYCEKAQALLDQWYAIDHVGCRAAIQRFAPERASEFALDEQETRHFQEAYDRAMSATDASSLKSAIDATESDRVRELVRSEAHKDRGNRDEDVALDQVQASIGSPITGRNACLTRRRLHSDDDVDIVIMGRVDGWRREANEIVEVKNRMRRFFDRVPLYERIQMQVYMWMTDAITCRLVQRLHGQVRHEVVDRDSDFLQDTVWPKVITVVKYELLPVLQGDEQAQKTLIDSGLLPERYKKT